LAPYSPQQNRVSESKNMALIEMVRTILDEYKPWSIRRVIPQTISIFRSFSRGHPMSSLPVISQIFFTLESLESSAMIFKRSQSLLNLLLKYIKDFYLAMIQTHVHIVFSTRTLVVLKPHVARCLIRQWLPS
jgi:hypothetical protein